MSSISVSNGFAQALRDQIEALNQLQKAMASTGLSAKEFADAVRVLELGMIGKQKRAELRQPKPLPKRAIAFGKI